MKERGLAVLVWVAAAVIAILPMAMGCGGSGSSPISYDGEETADLVGGATAAEYLTNGYAGVDAVSVLAATMMNGESAPAALSAEVMPQIMVTVHVENTFSGKEDGSFTIDWMVNKMTKEFAGTISYDGYSSRPGQSITGDADVEGEGYQELGWPGEIELTFSDMTIVNWGETWKATGSMLVENGLGMPTGAATPLFTADTTITIDEMILKSPDGITMKLEDAEIGVDLSDEQYWMTINSGEKGARLYHPDYGYLYISVWAVDSIGVSDKTGLPFTGVVRITDEIGGYAWLVFSANGVTYWDVWLDGGNNVLDYGTMGSEPDDTRVTGGTFEDGVFSVTIPG